MISLLAELMATWQVCQVLLCVHVVVPGFLGVDLQPKYVRPSPALWCSAWSVGTAVKVTSLVPRGLLCVGKELKTFSVNQSTRSPGDSVRGQNRRAGSGDSPGGGQI